MQLISKRIYFPALFLLLLLCDVRAKLSECGEFNEYKFSEFPYQNELENIFDAFDENNTQQMEQMLTSMENIVDVDDLDHNEYEEDRIKNVPDRIKAEGYPCEVHEVITEDGYILELYRIPYGRKSPASDQFRPPIFLMHCFMESSNGWIVLGPNHSIAYMLADAGYDVWLANARGTTPGSRRHIRLPTTGLFQKKYWSFSLHELGVYDLPAFIDHILVTTNQEKLNYIGFSQGVTLLFILTSMRPEYNDKIIEAQLLGPAVYFTVNHRPYLNFVKRYYQPMRRIFEVLRIYKLTFNNKLLTTISEISCRKATKRTPLACKFLLGMLFDSNQINCTTLTDILSAAPAPYSLRQGLHYVQFLRSGGFNQFDYDNIKTNQKMYGSDTPPAYNLSQVTVPINLYYSKDDSTVPLENVVELQTQIRNLKSSIIIPINDFNHVDFLYSRYVRYVVNEEVLSNINKVNGK